MGFGHAQFPRKTGVVDGISGRRPCSAVIGRDQDHLGTGLCHTGCNRTHTGLRYQLNRDPGFGVGILKVVDQLGQVFNGVYVMMGRRGDQAHPSG